MPSVISMLDGEEVDAATLVMAQTAYNWSRAVAYAMHSHMSTAIGVPKAWDQMSDSEKLAWVRIVRRWLM